MAITCKICERRVLRHARILTCSVCHLPIHIDCLPYVDTVDNIQQNPWICTPCTKDIFPFNHLDDEFINALSEMWVKNTDFPFSQLQDIIFNPFEINDTDTFSPLFDTDPDFNYFNSMTTMNVAMQSDYFTENSFIKKLQQNNVLPTALSLIHINIRSIPKHFDEWEYYLETLQFKFNIIGISETWLREENVESYNMKGYQHVYQYRSNRKGGGVSLFVSNFFNFNKRSDLCVNQPYMESVFIEIPKVCISNKKDLIIGVLYRPPNTDVIKFNEQLGEVLDVVKRENKDLYIMGDFNINLLEAENHPPSADFIDTLFANHIFPLISKPTRITKDKASLIDNIFHNNLGDNEQINGILFTEISDHFPIFTINLDTNIDSRTGYDIKRNYNSNNVDKFCQNIQQFDWQEILFDEDGKHAFHSFYQKFTATYYQSFPLKKSHSKYHDRKPWLSQGLKKSIKHKNQLYAKYMKNPTQDNFKIYKDFKRNLYRLTKLTERNHFKQQIEDNKSNLKKLWQVLKTVINKKSTQSTPSSFKINDSVVSNMNDITNSFNTYFTNIGKTLAKKIPRTSIDPLSYIPNRCPHSIVIQPVTQDEVINIIRSLKDSSAGYDSILANIVKKTFHLYISPLTHVLNLSLTQGFFPDAMKIARIVPLHKTGDPMLIKNYRPVSVLPLISKILEKLMHRRIYSFVKKYEILYENQFGFRENHSTCMAIITLLDKILSALDNGNLVIGVFLDFQKAFDTVNHQILLKKLEKYGIRGIALDWITDYLNNRQQYVILNKTNSFKSIVTCGVPQGSILGPLLFILYINDIVQASDALFPIIFADDTNIFFTGTDIDETIRTMNSELSKIISWLNTNQLSLNVAKTSYMVFKSARKHFAKKEEISINGIKLCQVESIKFLGVKLDSAISWKDHIQYVKNKASKITGILCLARKTLPRHILKTLYYSLAYPHFTYCIEVWGNAASIYLDSVFKVQKRAIRILNFMSSRSETTSVFKTLGILTLKLIYRHRIICFMFKFVKDQLPTIFSNIFTKVMNIAQRQTRQLYKLKVPRCKSTRYMKSIKYQGVIEWNEISNKIEHFCSYHTFKQRAKQYLLS